MICKLYSTRQNQLFLILEYRKGNVPRLKPDLNIKEKITLRMQSENIPPQEITQTWKKVTTWHKHVLILDGVTSVVSGLFWSYKETLGY